MGMIDNDSGINVLDANEYAWWQYYKCGDGLVVDDDNGKDDGADDDNNNGDDDDDDDRNAINGYAIVPVFFPGKCSVVFSVTSSPSSKT